MQYDPTPGQHDPGTSGITIMNSNGSSPTRVIEPGTGDPLCHEGSCYYGNPDWQAR